MRNHVLSGWNIIRLLRLLLGTAAAVQGIWQKEGFLVIAGIVFLMGALFNVGCCESAGCSVSSSKNNTRKKIEYEELGNTK